MTVTIDPSDVRRHATVKVRTTRSRLRILAVGAVGSVGLVAFTVGAFSFFSGLADPRARNVRPTPIASIMPDLKDGLPALKEADASAPSATIINLPKPPAAVQASAAEASTPVALPASTDATGSVAKRAAAAKAVPLIENAPVVAAEPKSSPVIAPSRSETVQAKPVETRTVAAVAAPPVKAEATDDVVPPVQRQAAAPAKASDAKKAAKASAPKSADTKVVTAKPAAKPAPGAAPAAVADATPVARRSAESDDNDGIGSKLKSGIKAIFGEE